MECVRFLPAWEGIAAFKDRNLVRQRLGEGGLFRFLPWRLDILSGQLRGSLLDDRKWLGHGIYSC